MQFFFLVVPLPSVPALQLTHVPSVPVVSIVACHPLSTRKRRERHSSGLLSREASRCSFADSQPQAYVPPRKGCHGYYIQEEELVLSFVVVFIFNSACVCVFKSAMASLVDLNLPHLLSQGRTGRMGWEGEAKCVAMAGGTQLVWTWGPKSDPGTKVCEVCQGECRQTQAMPLLDCFPVTPCRA